MAACLCRLRCKCEATASSDSAEKEHLCIEPKSASEIKQTDLFRDTPVRYLGYANEIGEAFRSQVNVNVVRFTYLVASAYVCADAYSKGQVAAKRSWPDEVTRQTKVTHAVLDTLLWQGLASVAIPGFTINRICALSALLLRHSSRLPPAVSRWTTTAIGLASIPFIIKPIDRSVDGLMEATVRRWYHIGPIEETIVHHRRDE